MIRPDKIEVSKTLALTLIGLIAFAASVAVGLLSESLNPALRREKYERRETIDRIMESKGDKQGHHNRKHKDAAAQSQLCKQP